MSDIRLREDWRSCPVIYPKPDGALIGEIVPLPKPTLDATLMGLGYKSAGDVLIRVGTTQARRPQRAVDLWYVDRKGCDRRAHGEGSTIRDAYYAADRIRRQVEHHGSIVAALAYGRDRAVQQGITFELEWVG